MNSLEKMLLRRLAKPKVLVDDGERLTLSVAAAKMLPADSAHLLSGIENALVLLPGITEAGADGETGQLALRYDCAQTSQKEILRWYDCLTETVLSASDRLNIHTIDAAQMKDLANEALLRFRRSE